MGYDLSPAMRAGAKTLGPVRQVRGFFFVNNGLTAESKEQESTPSRGRCPNEPSIQRPKLAIRKQRGSQQVRINPNRCISVKPNRQVGRRQAGAPRKP
jgi:hypothetical protein